MRDATALAQAYAAARYGVLVDGDAVELRVGAPAADLEAYVPAARYGLLTAWNPRSQPQSDAANRTADAELVSRLQALGLAHHRAWSEAPDGGWREDGWLLLDPAFDLVHALGREFGQAAVLAWRAGADVRVHMLVARGDGDAAADPRIDWIE